MEAFCSRCLMAFPGCLSRSMPSLSWSVAGFLFVSVQHWQVTIAFVCFPLSHAHAYSRSVGGSLFGWLRKSCYSVVSLIVCGGGVLLVHKIGTHRNSLHRVAAEKTTLCKFIRGCTCHYCQWHADPQKYKGKIRLHSNLVILIDKLDCNSWA